MGGGDGVGGVFVVDGEVVVVVVDRLDAPGVEEGDVGGVGGVEECVEDCARFVGGWEELAGGFLLECDAQIGEEVGGVADGEAAEDGADGFGC